MIRICLCLGSSAHAHIQLVPLFRPSYVSPSPLALHRSKAALRAPRYANGRPVGQLHERARAFDPNRTARR